MPTLTTTLDSKANRGPLHFLGVLLLLSCSLCGFVSVVCLDALSKQSVLWMYGGGIVSARVFTSTHGLNKKKIIFLLALFAEVVCT